MRCASCRPRSATTCSRTWRAPTARCGSEHRTAAPKVRVPPWGDGAQRQGGAVMAMAAAGPQLASAALRVRHLTRYSYDAAVELAHHLAHLRPRETPWQLVSDWRIDVLPEPDAGAHAIDASTDVFGNWRHCFSHARVHDRLEVASSFVAALQQRALQPGSAGPPWEQVAARLRYSAGSTMPEACEFALGSPRAPR